MKILTECPFCKQKLWIEPFYVDIEFENEDKPHIMGFIVLDPQEKITRLTEENDNEKEKTRYGEMIIKKIEEELKDK